MKIIADLHLHSKYSRAVSQQMVIPEIARWAAKKGIGLVGTGDWTHPLWLRELRENLEEVREGLYALRSPTGSANWRMVGSPHQPSPLFLLSTEISSIYTQGGKPHRIHNLIFAPSFSVVEEINNKLRNRGVNLLSDGRPMTGLSSIELCELVFSISQDCLVIPSHAWTPWYSLYGSNSGFDSIKECFGEFADKIYAIETGLSSDPAMNWRIEELDSRQIVSFSDAHSGPKLGREATVFELSKVSYGEVKRAIMEVSREDEVPRVRKEEETHDTRDTPDSCGTSHISYTIEFYPEEGKYHYTGHRNCKVKFSPSDSQKLGTTCPVCGKPLTVGVMDRVEKLSPEGALRTRQTSDEFGVRWISDNNRPPYVMLVPLQEILSEALGSLPASQNVQNEYNKLTENLGGEFKVLLETPLSEIEKISGTKVAEGIKKTREGKIVVDPGYDGEFGKVKIWGDEEEKEGVQQRKQLSFFE